MLAIFLLAAAVAVTTFLILAPARAQAVPQGVDNLHDALLNRSRADRLFKPALAGTGKLLAALLPHRRVEVLYERAVAAGIHGFWTRQMIAMSRLASIGTSALFAWLIWQARPGVLAAMFGVLLIAIGWRLIDTLLTNRARVRQDMILSALPDYADQIAICVQAGLTLDQALRRTASTNDGPLSEEFHRFLRDIRVGTSRRLAYASLAERVDVTSMSSFVRALSNAERNGVSVADVLEVQAEELRNQRRQRAEERAMRLPVLMLFPMTFCILPPLLAVLIGPVLIELVRSGLG